MEAEGAEHTPSAPEFFTRDINVAGLLKIHARITGGLTGMVANKPRSGEPHGPNLVPIELVKGRRRWLKSPLTCRLTTRNLQGMENEPLMQRRGGSHPSWGADAIVSNCS